MQDAASASNTGWHGMRRFDVGALAPSPWRNGGGVTRDVARGCFAAALGPDTSGLAESEAWDWRLSAACVAADGPFSRFEGIDRVAVLLQGRIALQAQACVLALRQVGDMQAFPGEALLGARLGSSEAWLLNAMVRRDRAEMSASVVRGSSAIQVAHGTRAFRFAAEGRFRVRPDAATAGRCAAFELDAGHGLELVGPCGGGTIEQLSAQACLVLVDFRARRG